MIAPQDNVLGVAKALSDSVACQLDATLEILSASDLLKEQPFADVSAAQLMTMPDVDKRKRVLDLVGKLLHQSAMEAIEARTERGVLMTCAYLAPNTDRPTERESLIAHLRNSMRLTHKALRLAEDHLNHPPMIRKVERVTGDFDGVRAYDVPVEGFGDNDTWTGPEPERYDGEPAAQQQGNYP